MPQLDKLREENERMHTDVEWHLRQVDEKRIEFRKIEYKEKQAISLITDL